MIVGQRLCIGGKICTVTECKTRFDIRRHSPELEWFIVSVPGCEGQRTYRDIKSVEYFERPKYRTHTYRRLDPEVALRARRSHVASDFRVHYSLVEAMQYLRRHKGYTLEVFPS